MPREGLRPPSSGPFPEAASELCGDAGVGALGGDDITVSHTEAGLPRGLGAAPLGPHRRSRSHSRAPGRAARAGHTRAHLRRAPATLARTLPRRSLPGLRLGPSAAAPRRRRHGCPQLLPSAVQQPRPPAGPPRLPAAGTAPGRWPRSRLVCSPGRSEDGRVAVPAASPSQRPEPGGFRGNVSAPPGQPGTSPRPILLGGGEAAWALLVSSLLMRGQPGTAAGPGFPAALRGFAWWLLLVAFGARSGMGIWQRQDTAPPPPKGAGGTK